MDSKILKQWNIIKELAKLFQENDTRYHFDGSTSVFVHGIHFDMDDIDIVFPFDSINETRELFKEYDPSEVRYVKNIGLKHFCLYIRDEKIHCLFYECSFDDFSKEEVKLVKDYQVIWAKSLNFYLRHAKKEDILVPQIKELLNSKKEL